MKNKINTFLKVYPWYYSLSCWLLFYDILNTLYLTTVKGLSAAEFSLLSAIALFTSIVLQIPLLKVIKKHKNDEPIHPHELKPNYLKKTEAEENLNG